MYQFIISPASLFSQNEAVKYCPVKIIDDSLYEKDEKFQVKLLPYLGAAIGKTFSSAEVIILADEKDGKAIPS